MLKCSTKPGGAQCERDDEPQVASCGQDPGHPAAHHPLLPSPGPQALPRAACVTHTGKSASSSGEDDGAGGASPLPHASAPPHPALGQTQHQCKVPPAAPVTSRKARSCSKGICKELMFPRWVSERTSRCRELLRAQ